MEIAYKGFTAKICFSSTTDSFYGEVDNADMLIAFQADTLGQALSAMEAGVDRYLALVEENVDFS